MKGLAVLLGVFFTSFSTLGAQVHPKVIWKTDTLLLGSPDSIWLEIRQERKFMVLWPNVADSLGGHLQILGRTPLDSFPGNNPNEITYKQGLKVVAYDSGAWVMPTIPFSYWNGTDSLSDAFDSMSFFVAAPAVDLSKDFKDLEGEIHPGFHWLEWFPWLLATFISLLLVGLGVWWYIRRQKHRPKALPLPIAPTIDPLQLALDALQEIENKARWKSGDVKGFYSDIVDVIRKFTQGSFGVDVWEMTSTEWLNWWVATGNGAQAEDRLKELLHLADLVKFAKMQPSVKEHAWMTETCRQWLKQQKTTQNNPHSQDPKA